MSKTNDELVEERQYYCDDCDAKFRSAVAKCPHDDCGSTNVSIDEPIIRVPKAALLSTPPVPKYFECYEINGVMYYPESAFSTPPVPKEVEAIVEEFNKQISPPNYYETYGDGHYCTHHPDDPAHGDRCYEHPLASELRTTLHRSYADREEAIAMRVREEEANEYNKIIEREVEKTRQEERERVLEAVDKLHSEYAVDSVLTGSLVLNKTQARGILQEYLLEGTFSSDTSTKTDV